MASETVQSQRLLSRIHFPSCYEQIHLESIEICILCTGRIWIRLHPFPGIPNGNNAMSVRTSTCMCSCTLLRQVTRSKCWFTIKFTMNFWIHFAVFVFSILSAFLSNRIASTVTTYGQTDRAKNVSPCAMNMAVVDVEDKYFVHVAMKLPNDADTKRFYARYNEGNLYLLISKTNTTSE